MVTTHNLGFPRIGAKRELKFALEQFWAGHSNENELQTQAAKLRQQNWQRQSNLDWQAVGDFSLYDQVLDMSFLLGHVPSRVSDSGSELDRYFRVARGRSAQDSDCQCSRAGEMTKWFDTNYHFIVPELEVGTEFTLQPRRLLQQVAEAKSQGYRAKPVIIGPLTYLALSKTMDSCERLSFLPKLLEAYSQLLNQLADHGCEWVQIDEPLLSTELDAEWQHAFNLAYHQLKACKGQILLATYFSTLEENLRLACELPVNGLHIDAVSASEEIKKVMDWLPVHKVLSLGVINGRNIWKTDLNAVLDILEPIHERLGNRLWLAPSCSLLHVPVDLNAEANLDAEIKNWLAFAQQKVDELLVLATALNKGRDIVAGELAENAAALVQRKHSAKVNKPEVQAAVLEINGGMAQRQSAFNERNALQQSQLKLPSYPTTSIGSFPQTAEIRQQRKAFKEGRIKQAEYRQFIEAEIKECIAQQIDLGLDVLVHGEAERNDMVEYFGEHLLGFAFTEFAWVQSYGSRCVKPPIIYGDISRPKPITVEWATYAQSLSEKPVKGMLTGPVTILNWSFVRDDQSRQSSCEQIALAIRGEVQDLEAAGIAIIQIDEAALREGLPLRRSQWPQYLDWAVNCFRLCANGVEDATQIHTHMCYSEFNDIIGAIAAMDADVITIETSRSNMELLDVFDDFSYPNDLGPGVYDIHSPNIPSVDSITKLMTEAAKRIPAERLWVNPDCGLKTRAWQDVLPALKNMVAAAHQLRSGEAAC